MIVVMPLEIVFRRWFTLAAWIAFVSISALTQTVGGQTTGDQWPTYGGDPGGMRFTNAKEITPANVKTLAVAWTFHTGALGKGRPGAKNSSFEATPILFHGALYLSSPYDDVYALNPETGKLLWAFDPKLTRNMALGLLTSRGVAAWPQVESPMPHPLKKACAGRIFVATMDARLLALDAANGHPCMDFGDAGTVDLTHVVGYTDDSRFFNTSPPTVIGNLVIVGSLIGDNQLVSTPSGAVRAFDVHSGALVWSWEPLPWAHLQRQRTGAGNTWSVISADPANNLVFLPTGAASNDFYGGTRIGDDRDANSVVALEATTGRRVWGFQVVHHDLWDYDVAAEPLLFTFRGKIPAIAITTKQGLVFILNRLTGEPLYPVEERPVPSSDVPGEVTWPTQPFQKIDSLAPLTIDANARLGATPQDDKECRQIISGLRYDGIYTPPSLRGSIEFPGNLGGVNWGAASFDPNTGVLYANTNRYAFSVRLIRKERTRSEKWAIAYASHKSYRYGIALAAVFGLLLLALGIARRPFSVVNGLVIGAGILIAVISLWGIVHRKVRLVQPMRIAGREAEHFGPESGEQEGTPYTMYRSALRAPNSGNPCMMQPWGTVSAMNLNTGKLQWQVPLGTMRAGEHTGTINLGGDLVTATGLLFTAASQEPLLRAFDSSTGTELWQGRMSAPAQATPMSYNIRGRQYVVIAAGGHGLFGTPVSDAVVAFALPK